jgi:hypothetical protein
MKNIGYIIRYHNVHSVRDSLWNSVNSSVRNSVWYPVRYSLWRSVLSNTKTIHNNNSINNKL